MIEKAKRESLAEVTPKEIRTESNPIRTRYVDPEKELNCDIAEREMMRKARLDKFQKN